MNVLLLINQMTRSSSSWLINQMTRSCSWWLINRVTKSCSWWLINPMTRSSSWWLINQITWSCSWWLIMQMTRSSSWWIINKMTRSSSWSLINQMPEALPGDYQNAYFCENNFITLSVQHGNNKKGTSTVNAVWVQANLLGSVWIVILSKPLDCKCLMDCVMILIRL